MWIKFRCECGNRVKSELLNSPRTKRCPHCGQRVAVPHPSNDLLINYLEPKTIPTPTIPDVALIEMAKRLFGRFQEIFSYATLTGNQPLVEDIKSTTIKILVNIKIYLNDHARKAFSPEDQNRMRAEDMETWLPASSSSGLPGIVPHQEALKDWANGLSEESFSRPLEPHVAESLIVAMIENIRQRKC